MAERGKTRDAALVPHAKQAMAKLVESGEIGVPDDMEAVVAQMHPETKAWIDAANRSGLTNHVARKLYTLMAHAGVVPGVPTPVAAKFLTTLVCGIVCSLLETGVEMCRADLSLLVPGEGVDGEPKQPHV